jgi:hypothetical protein
MGCKRNQTERKGHMAYRVTYSVDSLDPNPVVKTFEEEWEALDWVYDEVENRTLITLEDSYQYPITQEDYDHEFSNELSLVIIEEV